MAKISLTVKTILAIEEMERDALSIMPKYGKIECDKCDDRTTFTYYTIYLKNNKYVYVFESGHLYTDAISFNTAMNGQEHEKDGLDPTKYRVKNNLVMAVKVILLSYNKIKYKHFYQDICKYHLTKYGKLKSRSKLYFYT